MTYIYERGLKRKRAMHIQRFGIYGNPIWMSLCGIKLPFNTTCNFPLGQPICKRCQKEVTNAEPR